MQNIIRHFLIIITLSLFSLPMYASLSYASEEADIERKLEAIDYKMRSASQEKFQLATQTQSIKKRLGSLRERLIEQSRKVQRYQRNMTVLNDRISQIEFEISDLSQTLNDQRNTMSSMILTAQRLSRVPPQALLIRPDRPLNIARTGLLIKTTLPSIQEQSTELSEQIAKMRELDVELRTKRSELETTHAELDKEQAVLEKQITQRKALLEKTQYAQKQKSEELKELAKTSQNLKSLLDNLAQQPVPSTKPSIWSKVLFFGSGGKGQFVMPVLGNITKTYSRDHRGITIDALRGGVAVAPADGVILFAASFRQYKLLVIIQHPTGHHSLIGGLDEVYVSPKTQILAGEPIGKLKSGTDKKVSLYFELRRDGEPIDPLSIIKS